MRKIDLRAAYVGLALIIIMPGSLRGGDFDYQAHYLYVGESPSNDAPDWSDRPSGLAHSDTHWFITEDQRIWRIPVSADLGDVHANSPAVSNRYLEDIPALQDAGIVKFGDPCAFRYGDTDYLLIPVGTDLLESSTRLAVFRGDSTSLEFLAIAEFPSEGRDFLGGNWCGIDVNGYLYSSPLSSPKSVERFVVAWPLLAQSGVLSLAPDQNVALLRENGSLLDPFGIFSVVSGDVSPDGRLAYFVILFSEGYSIHVFGMPSGLRVQQSTSNSGYFDFDVSYSPPDYTVAQGLTIWDLEGTDSPHRGNLHVLINDVDIFSDNEIAIKHYTRTIRVDGQHNGEQNGTPESPFRTVGGALGFAWDGSEIRLRANDYLETMIVNKRVRMTAEGGAVRIGE